MNPLIGTLILFSGIFCLFFSVPISGLFLMSKLGPASIEPTSRPIPTAPTLMPIPEPLGEPICIQKVSHRGNYVWVDAIPFAAD